MMTLFLTLLCLALLFVSEVIGDLRPIIQDQVRVAAGIVALLLVVWIIAKLSVGQSFIPDAMSWQNLRPNIVIEKCRMPC